MGGSMTTVARCCAGAIVVCAVVVVCGVVGCGGSATIQFVSLHPSEIDPPGVMPSRFDAEACYWWVDEAGDLNIAMKCRRHNLLLGRYGRVALDLSLRLDEPPAGSGRNYRVGRSKARALFVSALHNLRLPSQGGIVGVTVGDDGTLRGSFRIWMKPQAGVRLFSFLPRRPGRLLCFGTFEAVKDAERGGAIRADCEAGGWTRPPRRRPIHSQPATVRGVKAEAP